MKTTPKAVGALLALAALLACGARPAAAQQAGASRAGLVARGTLTQVTGRRRVALLVSKALVVDARDPALVAVEDYRRALAGETPRLHAAGARAIASKLNKYIRKYRMMTAAGDYGEADLVLVFQVTGQRRSAIPTEPYVWGKLYVIALNADRAPLVVWETEGDSKQAEDAADDFLKAYKAARGEK